MHLLSKEIRRQADEPDPGRLYELAHEVEADLVRLCRAEDRMALLESPLFWALERRWTGGEWGRTDPTHEAYRVGLRHPDPNRALVLWTDEHPTAAEAIDEALLMADRLQGES